MTYPTHHLLLEQLRVVHIILQVFRSDLIELGEGVGEAAAGIVLLRDVADAVAQVQLAKCGRVE